MSKRFFLQPCWALPINQQDLKMKDVIFHVGHHKTATSWLQSRYFIDHPQINLISNSKAPWDDKLLNYLIGSTQRNFNTSRCIKIFNDQLQSDEEDHINMISAERLSGHPFSGGYDSFIIAERIYSCFPKAKIIIVVRNQIDMLRSIYQQLVKEGYLGNFTDFIKSKRWKGTTFSMDFLEYDLLISKYIELFSEKNVLILVYEDLRKNQQMYLNSISSFLNIEGIDYRSNDDRVNKSLKNTQIRAMRLINQFRKTELNPFPIIKIHKKFVNGLSRILSPCFVFAKPELIENDEIEYIKSYYSESNQRLRKLLSRDLLQYP